MDADPAPAGPGDAGEIGEGLETSLEPGMTGVVRHSQIALPLRGPENPYLAGDEAVVCDWTPKQMGFFA